MDEFKDLVRVIMSTKCIITYASLIYFLCLQCPDCADSSINSSSLEEQLGFRPEIMALPRLTSGFHLKLRKNTLIIGKTLMEIDSFHQPFAAGAFHRGHSFNVRNGRFSAPVTGIYQFSVNLHIRIKKKPKRSKLKRKDVLTTQICIDSLCQHHTSLQHLVGLESSSRIFTASFSGFLQLQIGQYASVYVDNASNLDIVVKSHTENPKLIANLTDVGLYSYSALCCVALSQLFNDEENKEFSTSTLEAINKHICLPSQAAAAIMEMLRSSCCDEGRPFADSLLAEKCLNNNGLPVITDLLTMAVFHGQYDARIRVMIKFVSWQLRVSWDQVEEVEALIAETLEAKQYEMSEEELKEKKKKSRNAKLKRFALIGLATVGGGALVGLTGGLAAPLVAAGAASIIGGAGAAALGTTAGVAIIGSLFGVAGAGLTGYKMKKRVGAIEEFEFETLLMYGKQLHITIAISGWLSDHVTDFKIPWQHLAESREQYTLRWESKYLKQLGTAMDYIFNTAMSMATQEALKYTILSGIISAIAWPGALLSVAGVIDNPWSVCIQRATAAGKQLAEVLLAREQGNRPVTLVGYSLGSRVIFSCLEELARRKGSQGIIEDVVILGSPCTGSNKVWEKIGSVVAGRIINGYARGDWLLKFLFRTVNVEFNHIAGLGPIKWSNRRMHNIDLSDVVKGHKDYLKELPTILRIIGINTRDDKVKGQGPSHIPPHKLLPNSDNCDFTSSEEEDETQTDSHSNSKHHHGDQDHHHGDQGCDLGNENQDETKEYLDNKEKIESKVVISDSSNTVEEINNDVKGERSSCAHHRDACSSEEEKEKPEDSHFSGGHDNTNCRQDNSDQRTEECSNNMIEGKSSDHVDPTVRVENKEPADQCKSDTDSEVSLHKDHDTSSSDFVRNSADSRGEIDSNLPDGYENNNEKAEKRKDGESDVSVAVDTTA
ncbi:hypothetical protein FSP39_021535 [Pinctada imbricata]|uniref:C1q domain-containing protein n=1 Tax=Pinctada imbricata TaxID=66713 RepID=A0AA89C1S5_PINIB|nr:hypothetical protein FSP39_021535 [Pinctada imbricata]